MPAILVEPTREDAERAAAVIEDIIGQFPFVLPADRANGYALLLSPLVRQYIVGLSPMALLDSPTRGSGKSLLAKMVAVVATGTVACVTDCPTGEEEMAKKIAAVLSTGRTVVVFDNVETTLKHASLGLVLTAEEFEQRLLGRNDVTLRLKNRCTWIATGNNLAVGGDMDRRCYTVRIDPKCPRPWQRPNSDFRHPFLLDHVKQQRGTILAALLTMCRAWIVAGKPKPKDKVPVLGVYERWTETVGGILAYVGVDGFLENLDRLYEQTNVEAAEWTAFLEYLFDREIELDDANVDRTRPFTAAELATRIRCTREYPDRSFQASLATWLPSDLIEACERSMDSFAKTLGRALARKDGVRFGERGLFVERGTTKDRLKGRQTWVVRRGL